MIDWDKTIEEFIKTRTDKQEIKALKTFPSMLGDLIDYARQGKDNKDFKSDELSQPALCEKFEVKE